MEKDLVLLIAVFSFLGVAGMLLLVFEAERDRLARTVVRFIFTCFMFFVAGVSAFKQGKVVDRELNPRHSYTVQAKGLSDFSTPILVYDMVDKRSRIIEPKEYPPVGFKETVTVDGRILLLPK